MCRLSAYIGTPMLAADLVTRPNRSIIKQSFDARERLMSRGYLNGDGFGLGWYQSRIIINHYHQNNVFCLTIRIKVYREIRL